jgi:hypothetical protein
VLINPNLIHARAAIQVDIEEGLDWDYAVETAQIVYKLTNEELIDVLQEIKGSIWSKKRLERN